MSKFDSEDLLDSILDIMQVNTALNTKITEVEAEKIAKSKALTPTLATIPLTNYYRQTWVDKILNTSPAIFYGIEDVQTEDGGGAAKKTYRVFVDVVLIDSGQTNDSDRRLSRYSRALEELFEAAFSLAGGESKIKIDSVRPIAFKLELDSNDEIKVGGVSLTISLA